MILLLNPIDDLHIFFVFFSYIRYTKYMKFWRFKMNAKVMIQDFWIAIHCKPDKSETHV